jgi:hypothetical protein
MPTIVAIKTEKGFPSPRTATTSGKDEDYLLQLIVRKPNNGIKYFQKTLLTENGFGMVVSNTPH